MDVEEKTDKRRPFSLMLTSEERAILDAAAGAEAVAPGANVRDHTTAAWIRRVALREAERARREGM
jgi:hypothetical protein